MHVPNSTTVFPLSYAVLCLPCLLSPLRILCTPVTTSLHAVAGAHASANESCVCALRKCSLLPSKLSHIPGKLLKHHFGHATLSAYVFSDSPDVCGALLLFCLATSYLPFQ